MACFWSVGGQYQGPIPTRDGDVLGIGFARGRLVADAGFEKEHESVLEIYYNCQLTGWCQLTPSIQYVWNPGGAGDVGNAVVLGVRLQVSL
jgi:carbohydrate-selective porin OprB